MPKQPDNKNQSTRHHNRRSPEPGQNHALTLNGRIMVLLLVIGFIVAGFGNFFYALIYIGGAALLGVVAYLFILGDVKRIELSQ